MSEVDALEALVDRLRAVDTALFSGPVTGRGSEPANADTATTASYLLGRIVARIHAAPSHAETWLLLTAVAAAIPGEEDVLEFVRRLELDGPPRATRWLLQSSLTLASTVGSPLARLDIVTRTVLVNVDFVAQNDLHTGIQRVVRETVSRWNRDHSISLCVWTASGAALRGLTAKEQERAAYWGLTAPELADNSPRLVVPWNSTVLLPETLRYATTSPMRSLARLSGNRIVMIGYDAIPVTSAESLPDFSSEIFGNYLSALKYADLVVGISASAVEEFSGFGEMLAAQGLSAPEVRECLLPVDAPDAILRQDPSEAEPDDKASRSRSGRPTVMCVGSLAPHKNHLALLHASEVLWREGLDFELLLVGASGWHDDEFHARIDELSAAGRPVVVARRITDDELWELYRQARFTVFPSLHEGFGLPVAESLSYGTPVVTTRYGSTAEIGIGGGVLLVDPRDDEDLANAMRSLLIDDELLGKLAVEAATRTPRLWDDYASDLWALVSDAAA
jgi:glycosyltransferase involved in cell wall biosynthesis